jgi:Protein of unknown function (DUF4012)
VAVSVLLLSNDPHLGSSLEALAPGLLRVRNLEPSRQPATWPGRAASTVVLDLAAGERATAYSWVRQHHAGHLIVLLRPGEQASSLPPDPDRLVLRRPLGLSDLVEILSGLDPTNGPADGVPSSTVSQPTSGQKPAPGQGDLLRASAKQRGIRLGSLSSPAGPAPTATPGPLGAGTAGGAMPATEPAAQAAPPAASPEATAPGRETSMETASQAEAARPATPPTANGHQQAAEALPWPSRPPAAGRPATRPERRRLTLARGVVLGALAAVVIFGVWLALGLLQAREDFGVEAAGLRTELVKTHAALGRGDPAAAKTAIRAASRNLDAAEAIIARRPMRVAARLPVLGGGVSDVRHLLAAARNLTRAADRAVVVSEHLRSGRFAVLEHGRFDLEALDHAAAQAKGLVAELDRVHAELAQVRGGPFAPGADRTKRWALARLDEAAARARPVVPTLQALPGAVGAVRPQTYLVALTSPAELRPGGGVPLAVLEVTLDKGVVRVVNRDGEIVENVHNAQATWPAVAGDPWARGGRFTRFSLANSSPHFPTSGQELLRAYAAGGRSRPDGVVSLDPLAMRALLRTTGPVTVPGYGRLTADNCVRLTTHDAYVRWPNRQQRRGYNEALLDALIQRLLSGRDLVATGKVLGAAGARRQVQIYAADPQLQQALTNNGMYGGQSQAGQDYLAVYTLNANSSRMDYFQRRSIHQVVQLRPDGSAEVTRTITIDNDVPPSEPIRDGADSGYHSGRVAAVVATYLPPGAAPEEVTRDDRPVRPTVAIENGRPLVRLDVDLAPGQSTSVAVRYLTPKAAAAEAGFRFRLTADPQVLIRPPDLSIDVVAPAGMKLSAPSDWAMMDDGTAARSRRFTHPIDITFDVRR